MIRVPVLDPVQTGLNIIALRTRAGLSVRDLQAVFGFNSPQAIYRWQSGAAMPTVDNLIILAAVLQVTMDEIVATTQM